MISFTSSFESAPARLAKTLIGLVLLALLLVGMFNYLVDPYDFFRHELPQGLNKVKTGNNLHITRPHAFNRGRYDTLILGTSRALNLDANSPALAGKQAFNFAIHGSSVTQHYNNLVYSHTRQPLHTVIIGLDMMSYLAMDRVLPVGVTQASGGHDSDHYRYFIDAMAMLLSKKVLRESINTLETSRSYADVSGKPGREERTLRKGGYEKAFLETERSYLEHDGPWLSSRFDKMSPSQRQVMQDNLEVLQQIIDYCRSNNIELKLFISPVHARLLVAMDAADMWDMFVFWKSEVTAMVGRNRENFPGGLSLLDFALVNERTAEALPQAGTRDKMQWFYDSAHYTRAAGNEILATLVQGKVTPSPYRELVPESIGQQLAEEREHLNAYERQHPALLPALKAIFCKENPLQCPMTAAASD